MKISGRQSLLRYYSEHRTASSEHQEAYQIVADLMEEGVPEAMAQEGKTSIRKVMQLLKIPKILKALKDLLGKITIRGIRDLLRKGQKYAQKAFGKVKSAWFVIEKRDIPSVTGLIRDAEIGAKALGIYEKKAENFGKHVDEWLKRNMPNLGRLVIAAIFIWIWLNVDELSWDPQALVAGFTGTISFVDLLNSFPESGLGFITSQLWGVGYTVMPWALGARVLWALSKGLIKIHRGELVLSLPGRTP